MFIFYFICRVFAVDYFWNKYTDIIICMILLSLPKMKELLIPLGVSTILLGQGNQHACNETESSKVINDSYKKIGDHS